MSQGATIGSPGYETVPVQGVMDGLVGILLLWAFYRTALTLLGVFRLRREQMRHYAETGENMLGSGLIVRPYTPDPPPAQEQRDGK